MSIIQTREQHLLDGIKHGQVKTGVTRREELADYMAGYKVDVASYKDSLKGHRVVYALEPVVIPEPPSGEDLSSGSFMRGKCAICKFSGEGLLLTITLTRFELLKEGM